MTANDPDGSISSWVLDVDGDGNADYSGSGNPPSTQQHTYQNPGDYTAKLTVTDNDRTEGYCEETITVSEAPSQPLLCTTPDPPSHNFGSVPEEEITFWSFDITNCGGGTLTWTVSDDRAWITVNPLSGSTTTGIDTVTVTINTAGLSVGIHTGHVTVNSNDGSKTGTIMVNIQPSQPLIADAGGPYYGNTNEPIQFHGSATGGTPPYTYAWDFDINGVIDSVLQNPTHSWSSTGTYYPTLKVVDDKGGWSELDVCTVLIKTPPSYNGDLIGVHPQPHYSIGEIINIGVDIKNTGNTVETYDLHLVVHDKHDTPVHDDTIDSIYLSAGAEKSEKFSATSLPVGHYSFIASLSSSSSGKVYDDIQGNFRYSNFDAVMVEQKDAEPLKRAALDEVDAMVIVTSNTMLDMVSGLSWEVVKGIFEGKIKEIIENFDLFQGVLDQIYNKLGAIIDEFGVEEKLESKLYDAYKGYTATEEIKIFEQDDSFDAFIMNREFERDDKIIQAFKLGESVIREIMESGEIQKQRDRYEDLERLDESWWTFEIPKIGMVGTAFGMVASLPYTASEVTIEHSSILDSIKGLIRQQGSSGVSVLSISTDSQTVVGKETKFSITVDKKVSRTSEPIISVVISPDGRVIDMDLYKTNPYSNYETLSSGSIRLPHQPGKYKILAMTYGDMMKSSVKQVETTQTAPNILVSISTDKQFYNSSEIVTINATFINTGLEKIGNLTYSVNIQNTAHNKTGFLEIDASSTKIETLSFVPQTNGTYKAIVLAYL
jgi:PKD repeat protein